MRESIGSDIIDFFLMDASEHLQTVNDALLALENDNGDLSLVDKIFRAIHAIKGSAGMTGFSVVSQLAHRIEDLLTKIRDRSLGLSEVVIDLLFQAIDILAQQIENVANEQEEEKSALTTFDDLYVEALAFPELSKDQRTLQKRPPTSRFPGLSEVALAERYVRQNFFDNAVEIYRKILRQDPSNKTIRQRLEETLALQAYVSQIQKV